MLDRTAGAGLLGAMLAAAPLAAALLATAVPAWAETRIACDGGDATAALARALRDGGTIVLSPGVCIVSATLRIGGASVLRGAGLDRTLLRAARPPDHAILAVGGNRLDDGAADVDISSLGIDAGRAAADGAEQGPPGADGISVGWSSRRVSLHDLEVRGAGDNGIAVHGSDVTVTRDRVHDNQANGIYVIGRGHPDRDDAVPAARVQILGNMVYRNSLGRRPEMRHGWDGIDIDPITQDCLVEDNHVIDNDIILYENARVVPASRGHRVVGNLIEHVTQGGAGIDVAGPQIGFVLQGNTVRDVRGIGIVVNGPARDGIVRTNLVAGTTGPGIEIRDTGPTAALSRPTGLMLAGNDITAGAGQPAILLQHLARDVVVSGNILRGGGPGIVTIGPLPGLRMDENEAAPAR